jgi:hypothetical protein
MGMYFKIGTFSLNVIAKCVGLHEICYKMGKCSLCVELQKTCFKNAKNVSLPRGKIQDRICA